MNDRFTRPPAGEATAVRFPAVSRVALDNGLRIWTIPHDGVPVVAVSLVIPRGTADDPADRIGLASLTGDLLDEGAGTRDAIGLAEAFARLGTQLEIDVGPDTTVVAFSALARVLPAALQLVADVVMRPRFLPEDFARVRELRLNRLRQLSRSATTLADRTFVTAVFAGHPYGHGALGTTAALNATSLDDARELWSRLYGPSRATLVVCGAVEPAAVRGAAGDAFGAWSDPATTAPTTPAPAPAADRRVLVVDRPGAPQCEIRIGHVGPSRQSSAYHALVVLNAVLGGQFTSRINRRLREEKGVTYGAHTSFDFRRVAGSFSCDSSVQADAVAGAVADVLDEFGSVGREAVAEGELVAAKASLTRGYVRSFETAGQLNRAAVQLATYGLADDTFDRFVPGVEGTTTADVLRAAHDHVRPDDATVVVVGDAAQCLAELPRLGRPVVEVKPEF